jgi:uncharacterized coiled-coil protein SlyX
MKTKTQPIKNSMNSSSLRSALLLIGLMLACFGLSPMARAANETTSGANTGEGSGALQSITMGSNNTALGAGALFSLTTGVQNTAVGAQALNLNTGNFNTAVGFQAMVKNTSGFENVATGWRALFSNTTGFHNTADGFAALLSNTAGNHNTANGDFALISNKTGNFNTADGAHSLVLSTGDLNIALGFAAGQNLTAGSNNIDLATGGVDGETDTIRIGNQVAFTDFDHVMHPAHAKTFIAGIFGVSEGGTISQVTINSNGQLGTQLPVVSSRRFKTDIKPMDEASEAILALKPVTFRYKKEQDPKGIPQFGLVAEDVEKVNSDLITRDSEGKPYTVRYDAVNAMLLNEFLKEHKTVQELKSTAARQDATISELKSTVGSLAVTVKEQAAQIQKVSAQLETTKPVAQTVVDNH